MRGNSPTGAGTPPHKFQFTPLCEGRRNTLLAHVVGAGKFQFTPLREGRRQPQTVLRQNCISIHTLREGRRCPVFEIRPRVQFQFTPLREGRQPERVLTSLTFTFQFTPLREERPRPPSSWKTPKRFQFTPLREGRPFRIAAFFYPPGVYALMLGTALGGVATFGPKALVQKQRGPPGAIAKLRKAGQRQILGIIHGRTSLRRRAARSRQWG